MRWPTLAAAVCLALAACNDDTTGPTGEGSLVVSVTTSGGDPDLGGYRLDVDGDFSLPVPMAGTQELTLRAGLHRVALSDVAENCTIQGAATKDVTVSQGETVTVSFPVECGATGVTVQTQTTGLDHDPNGYRIVLDGGPYRTVSSNGSAVLSRLAPGQHVIEITEIAPNCESEGPTSRTVAVVNAELAVAEFPVVCQAGWGAIRVNANTTGSDPDGQYRASLVAFPGLTAQVDTEGGFILQVPAGTHQVRLDDVATNCTVAGGATREAVVTTGGPVRDTATVAFTVECVSDSGTIRVTVTTSGSGTTGPHFLYLWDSDCYYCSVVDSRLTDASGTGTVEFTPRSGRYYVTVGAADGCSPSGLAQSEQLTVTVGALLETQFEVACGPPLLRVTAPTSGTSPDSEYTVTLWYTDWWYYDTVSIPLGTLAAGGTLSAEAPFVGWFWVSLDDVAANCTVQVPNPSEGFYLLFGQTVELSFPVTCGP